jgi:hypothetical protein
VSYRTVCLIALVSLAGGAIAGPVESVSAAAADAQKLPAEIRHHVRYLSLWNIPAAQRKEMLAVLSFHVNSLSREPDVVVPALVAADLVRINFLDYGWKRDVWEKLAKIEPYYHYLDQRVIKTVEVPAPAVQATVSPPAPDGLLDGIQFYKEGGRGALVEVKREDIKEGETVWLRETAGAPLRKTTAVKRPVAKATPVAPVEQPKTVGIVPAPWLPKDALDALYAALNSDVPIVRADWFLYQTAIAKDRDGYGYYDFLNLGKKESDFQELIGADVKLAKKVKKEVAASVGRSSVTLNNRGIERFGTINGPYYRTQDYKTNNFKQNTLRLLDGDTDPPHGDASEQYGTLSNGLFAFWLQNAAGERQDTAPDFIASDGNSTSTDRRVHSGLSCIRCHSEGIRPVDDWMRRVYRGPVVLTSPDYEKLKRLRQLYLSDLKRQIEADQRAYAESLFKVNGLKPAENAAAYAKAWERYADLDLEVEDVAREIGTTKESLLSSLKKYAGAGQADPILAGLLADPPVPIRREHFEEVYGALQGVLAKYKGSKP